jgi:antitoxin VapB
MEQTQKARVFQNGRSQAVRIPAEHRFKSSEVYLQCDPKTGVVSLSERPFRKPIEEIFAEFDAAGGAEFEIERDLSFAPERELL